MRTLLYNYYFSIIIIIFSETEGEQVARLQTINNQKLLEIEEKSGGRVDHPEP